MKINRLSISVLFSFILLSTYACTEDTAKENYLVSNPAGLEGLEQFIPEDNLLTYEKIKLGEKLFFDERLSIDGTVSCGFCHNPLLGFSDGRYTSMGIYGLRGNRNAPTIVNRLFSQYQFLDGRAKDIEEVVIEHIQNKDEMANSLENLVAVLNNDNMYREEFQNVFGTSSYSGGIL